MFKKTAHLKEIIAYSIPTPHTRFLNSDYCYRSIFILTRWRRWSL